ncbi:MAG: ABC transporter permease [Bifidobacteriaceae bacterium]|jgi:putative ABC transport system permease protein|nr:ABC transporter permease [Bifidobacteriaceae bacterium]
MFIIKNATRNIKKALVRNILIGIIVLAIGVCSTIALAISNAATTLQENGLANTKITASISAIPVKMDSAATGTIQERRKALTESVSGQAVLTLDDYKKYADVSSVEGTYYSGTTSLNGPEDKAFVKYSTTEEDESEDDASQLAQRGGKASMDGGTVSVFKLASTDFAVTGYSSPTAMTEFQNGTKLISTDDAGEKEGAVFDFGTDNSEIIISDELASFNESKVGDEITLVNPQDNTITYTLKIVGIYTTAATDSDNASSMMGREMSFANPANAIYMNYETYARIFETVQSASAAAAAAAGEEGVTNFNPMEKQGVSFTYIFDNIENYEQFADQAATAGLDTEKYQIKSTDLTSFEASLTPLNNLKDFSNKLLWIVLAIGVVVLTIINAFNIRERKYEIGVYLGIGVNKAKVAMQFIVELLVVSLIAILIGVGAGAAASPSIANSLLEKQIATATAETATKTSNFGKDTGPIVQSLDTAAGQTSTGPDAMGGGPGGRAAAAAAPIEYVDSVDAAVNIQIVLELILAAALIVFLASLITVSSVMRYEPLRILADRT